MGKFLRTIAEARLGHMVKKPVVMVVVQVGMTGLKADQWRY